MSFRKCLLKLRGIKIVFYWKNYVTSPSNKIIWLKSFFTSLLKDENSTYLLINKGIRKKIIWKIGVNLGETATENCEFRKLVN